MTGHRFQSICVYCGSSDTIHPSFLTGARQLGLTLAKHQIRLVYGAGKTGLMGAVAGGVLAGGGMVTGVVPDSLNQVQLIAANLSALEVCPDMQTRKKRMHDLADGLIALPGGFGTLDELFEALTWAQIGLHQKPIGILNLDGFFDPMFLMIEHAAVEGFIYPEHKNLLVSSPDPEELLKKMEAYQPPVNLDRWVSRPKED
jgi:hypothetical protein